MKHISLFLLLLVAVVPSAMSQNADDVMRRHELSVNLGEVGMGCVMYDGGRYKWNNEPGINAAAGMGYTYWFSKHFGLTTGAEVAYMLHDERLTDVSSEVDGTVYLSSDGVNWVPTHAELMVTTPEVFEHQTIFMLQIPLKLSLKADHLFGNIGCSFAFPVTTFGKYSYSSSTFSVTNFTAMGISNFEGQVRPTHFDGVRRSYHPADVKYPFFFALSADIGWNFYFDRRNALSLGFYFNYSLNSCNVDDYNFDIIDVDKARASLSAPLQTFLVEKYRYFNAGFRLTYHFGFGKSL